MIEDKNIFLEIVTNYEEFTFYNTIHQSIIGLFQYKALCDFYKIILNFFTLNLPVALKKYYSNKYLFFLKNLKCVDL